ncbi:ABC transporter ATP-binding protein [Marinactinospora rubrisoli]|uniref:ABC transporter ATP-binding protein n=1 Tax=Marinactinospora rubrisoli TaxID=2715399 RepID=A0ABW2KJ36_9ACTN
MNETTTTGRVTLRDLLVWTRGSRLRLLGALICALAAAGLGLAQPMIVSRTIDTATAGQPVMPLLLLLTVVFVAQATTQALSTYRLDQAGETIVMRLRVALTDQLLRLRMAVFDRQRLGDLISRATTDTTLLRDVLAQDVVNGVVSALVVVGGLAMMLWLDPVLAAVVLAVVVVSGAVVGVVLKGIRRETVAAQEATGALAAEMERVLSAIRTVRVSRAEARESRALGDRADVIRRHNVRAARLTAVVSPAIEFGVQGSLVLVIVVGLYRVAAGDIAIGDLVAFLLYVNYLAVPMSSLFDIGPAIQTGIAAMQRLQEVVDLPTEEDSARPRPDAQAFVSVGSGLALRDVRFRYTDREILTGVSFQVPRHGFTAVAGPSGAGKTTIFNLLARFYDPADGVIAFDGKDAHSDHTLEEWRTRIGLVEQSSPLMYGTLRDNISYAAPDADEERLHAVIEMTGLTDLVRRLPDGLDTMVGEHGSTLSGGEQQRVAIARSLVARPEILLLDEPTSHLDAVNEQLLTRTLRRISTEHTLLVIAHRFSTLRAADRIIVLADGKVAACGSYEEVRDHLPPVPADLGQGCA